MSNSVYSSPDSDYEESFDNTSESEQVSGLEVFTQAIESSKYTFLITLDFVYYNKYNIYTNIYNVSF